MTPPTTTQTIQEYCDRCGERITENNPRIEIPMADGPDDFRPEEVCKKCVIWETNLVYHLPDEVYELPQEVREFR